MQVSHVQFACSLHLFEEWCLGCSVVKICLPKQEMQAQSLGRDDPLE